MTYYLARFVSFICCLMPRSLCEGLGLCLGNLAWLLIPGWRKDMAAANVRRCLRVTEKEAWRIAKASTVRFGPMAMEVMRFPRLKEKLSSYVTITGLEHLQRSIKGGKGAVIAAAHSGNWELMGGALAQVGIPLVGVAMKQKSAASDRFINEYRSLIGMHITYKTGVREMFDFLSKGWAIGLIMDQDTTRHDGILLNFFGQITNCTPGAASMARFKDAPLLTAFMHRDERGHHHLTVGEPIEWERTKDKKADIRRITQMINDRIEAHIRRYPSDWFWLHDRWKSIRDEFTPEEIKSLQ